VAAVFVLLPTHLEHVNRNVNARYEQFFHHGELGEIWRGAEIKPVIRRVEERLVGPPLFIG